MSATAVFPPVISSTCVRARRLSDRHLAGAVMMDHCAHATCHLRLHADSLQPGRIIVRQSRVSFSTEPFCSGRERSGWSRTAATQGVAGGGPRDDKDKDLVEKAREAQFNTGTLLAEFLQAENLEAKVAERKEYLKEDFFTMGSMYLEMARKEGNLEVFAQLQNILEVALAERHKMLRPEIGLLNKLLRQRTSGERLPTIQANLQYFVEGGYFFQILNQMTLDYDRQPANDQRDDMLVRCKSVGREVREAMLGVAKPPSSKSDKVDKPKPKGFGGR
eukprot:TRINITY_DN5165_c0_g1_i1.p1 TRINITY_DN5165_c0_g1~~TRINITY_DN5165_c0_g1_i1.p1  ORF type:complete len:276 (-),score=54.36 TRINITY_DN5165_c0_g1_i1:320-1147(-)